MSEVEEIEKLKSNIQQKHMFIKFFTAFKLFILGGLQIKDVNTATYPIKIRLENNRSFSVSQDSSELANLLYYNKASTPEELIETKIQCISSKFGNKDPVIPMYTDLISRIRYNLFVLSKIVSKYQFTIFGHIIILNFIFLQTKTSLLTAYLISMIFVFLLIICGVLNVGKLLINLVKPHMYKF